MLRPCPRARFVLDEVVDQLRRRIRHLDLEALDLVQEVVVHPHRRHGHEEAEGRRGQRLGDPGRHRAESARAGEGHPAERVDDADDRAEQSDERGRRGDGGQITEALLHLRGRHQRLPLDGAPRGRDEIKVGRRTLRRLVLKLRQARGQHARQMAVPEPLVFREGDGLGQLVLLEQRRHAEGHLQRLLLRLLEPPQALAGDRQRPDRHQHQDDDHGLAHPRHRIPHADDTELAPSIALTSPSLLPRPRASLELEVDREVVDTPARPVH